MMQIQRILLYHHGSDAVQQNPTSSHSKAAHTNAMKGTPTKHSVYTSSKAAYNTKESSKILHVVHVSCHIPSELHTNSRKLKRQQNTLLHNQWKQ
jgi:hypothetical protein